MTFVEITPALKVPVTTGTVLLALIGLSSAAATGLNFVNSFRYGPVIGQCLALTRRPDPNVLERLDITSDHSAMSVGSQAKPAREQTLAAAKLCKPGDCPSAARSAYLEAAQRYFAERVRALDHLSYFYGTNGVLEAVQRFNGLEDGELEVGLVARLHSQTILLRDFRQPSTQEAVGVLAQYGAAKVRPCSTLKSP
jgi:hypothetical protein